MDLTFIVQRDGEEEAIELSGPGAFKQLGADTLWKVGKYISDFICFKKCVFIVNKVELWSKIRKSRVNTIKMRAPQLDSRHGV